MSGFDRVAALAVLALGGNDLHAHLLADGPREKSPQGMRLPAGGFHQFLGGPKPGNADNAESGLWGREHTQMSADVRR